MSNLRQIGQALHIYANDNQDAVIPHEDSIAPHDIWELSHVVLLGKLLTENYIAMPGHNGHVFYCPSMEHSGGMRTPAIPAPGLQPGPYGFIYEKTLDRGFDGWFVPGRLVNIGYEYRSSLTETNTEVLKEITTYKNMTQVGNLALVSDIMSFGAGYFSHKFRYQFVRGDGGVSYYLDKTNPTLWITYGLSPDHQNDAMFLMLDHPLDYKNYVK
jgi:hypothetical protein